LLEDLLLPTSLFTVKRKILETNSTPSECFSLFGCGICCLGIASAAEPQGAVPGPKESPSHRNLLCQNPSRTARPNPRCVCFLLSPVSAT